MIAPKLVATTVWPAFALDPSFQWDGVPRTETMFITHFHARDTEYIRAISKRFLISGVARIFRPGCQLDTAPIIEGSQAFYKANALWALAIRDPDWYSNQVKTITEKNIAYLLAGKLIVEIRRCRPCCAPTFRA